MKTHTIKEEFIWLMITVVIVALAFGAIHWIFYTVAPAVIGWFWDKWYPFLKEKVTGTRTVRR